MIVPTKTVKAELVYPHLGIIDEVEEEILENKEEINGEGTPKNAKTEQVLKTEIIVREDLNRRR